MTLAIIKKTSKDDILNHVQTRAEDLFSSGLYYCSEAVVQTINEFLDKPFDDSIVKLASGFPVGLGTAGCLCGAVSGGQMALGIIYGRFGGQPMEDAMFEKAKGLHDFIRDEYKSTCCRVITKKWAGDDFKSEGRKNHCIEITGRVARWVANEMIEDGRVQLI